MKIIPSLLALLCAFSANAQPNAMEGLHLDWRNVGIAPGKNFYAYANGAWQKKNPIPQDHASWGVFSQMQDLVLERTHEILIQAMNDKQAKPGSIAQKVGDFYYSGMDVKTINAQGIKPLQPDLDQINQIKTLNDLQATITALQLQGVDALFSFGSMNDFKDSQKMIAVAYQAGLGLPNRDYYLKKDKKSQEIRNAYSQHIARMFVLMGQDPQQAVKEAKAVFSIEKQLAKVSFSPIQERDPYKIYHIMDRKTLQNLTPQFNWDTYFNQLQQPQIQGINMGVPQFFIGMNKLLTSVSIDDWKSYLRWHLIDAYASYLSKPFVDEDFKMTAFLSGSEKLLPRWKRVVSTENGALGFAIGQLYVQRYFPPASKKQAQEIVHNIRATLKDDLKNLPWMTPQTRKAALAKLDLMQERIGYPDKWIDYSKLVVTKGPYVLNIKRANQFLVQRSLNKIDKPVDPQEWAMTPQTINAYYDPSMNNINLPAGILQPPFFDPQAPAAVNYGAIGFVIGHEMTHGFDDQGAKFDGHGNLNDWWDKEDLEKFKKATHCIRSQFSLYKIDDSPVQGGLVVGEATADLGGVTLAYHAFHQSPAYTRAPILDGMTPDQQFFLGAAHVWAGNVRPEMARQLLATDPHPPMCYRVNGTLANMPEFQAAYHIQDPSPMVNKTRCRIW